MQQSIVVYTQLPNERYAKIGHHLQSKYKARLIRNDSPPSRKRLRTSIPKKRSGKYRGIGAE
jgi:hypothetical protein